MKQYIKLMLVLAFASAGISLQAMNIKIEDYTWSDADCKANKNPAASATKAKMISKLKSIGSKFTAAKSQDEKEFWGDVASLFLSDLQECYPNQLASFIKVQLLPIAMGQGAGNPKIFSLAPNTEELDLRAALAQGQDALNNGSTAKGYNTLAEAITFFNALYNKEGSDLHDRAIKLVDDLINKLKSAPVVQILPEETALNTAIKTATKELATIGVLTTKGAATNKVLKASDNPAIEAILKNLNDAVQNLKNKLPAGTLLQNKTYKFGLDFAFYVQGLIVQPQGGGQQPPPAPPAPGSGGGTTPPGSGGGTTPPGSGGGTTTPGSGGGTTQPVQPVVNKLAAPAKTFLEKIENKLLGLKVINADYSAAGLMNSDIRDEVIFIQEALADRTNAFFKYRITLTNAQALTDEIAKMEKKLSGAIIDILAQKNQPVAPSAAEQAFNTAVTNAQDALALKDCKLDTLEDTLKALIEATTNYKAKEKASEFVQNQLGDKIRDCRANATLSQQVDDLTKAIAPLRKRFEDIKSNPNLSNFKDELIEILGNLKLNEANFAKIANFKNQPIYQDLLGLISSVDTLEKSISQQKKPMNREEFIKIYNAVDELYYNYFSSAKDAAAKSLLIQGKKQLEDILAAADNSVTEVDRGRAETTIKLLDLKTK